MLVFGWFAFSLPLGWTVIAIAAGCFGAVHLFVVRYEEPTLRRLFRIAYEEYCRNVPRWRPTLTPWSPKPPGR